MSRFTPVVSTLEDVTSDGATDVLNVIDDNNVAAKPPELTVIVFEFFLNGSAVTNPSTLSGTISAQYRATSNSPEFPLPESPIDISQTAQAHNIYGTVISKLSFEWSSITGADQIRFIIFQR